MLVLARMQDEAIIIGTGPDRVRIVVTGWRWKNKAPVARIGIQAPPHVRIVREELLARVEVAK